jgi:hypothetical protein
MSSKNAGLASLALDRQNTYIESFCDGTDPQTFFADFCDGVHYIKSLRIQNRHSGITDSSNLQQTISKIKVEVSDSVCGEFPDSLDVEREWYSLDCTSLVRGQSIRITSSEPCLSFSEIQVYGLQTPVYGNSTETTVALNG